MLRKWFNFAMMGVNAGCTSTTLYLLVNIWFHGFLIVYEPNQYILLFEIALCSMGLVYMLKKMLKYPLYRGEKP